MVGGSLKQTIYSSPIFFKLVAVHNQSGGNGSSNGSWFPSNYVPFCLRVQTSSISDVISYWDLVLLIPNALFVLFLLFKWFRVRAKLRSINFPILTIFYNLILLVSLLMIIRCLVTVFIKPITPIGELVNKIVWLIVRLGQLSTELSVVLFGLFFARLESKKSIIRIMSLTIPISLIYIGIQATLEFLLPDKHYVVIDNNHYYDLYGHGGMVFWFVSSLIFCLVYTAIFLLPYTKVRNYFPIPTKQSFYIYCFALAALCFVQSLGAALTYANLGNNGLCILDITTLVYFTAFGPLVYIVFLSKFFQKESLFASSYFKPNESHLINGSLSDSMNNRGLNSPSLASPQSSTFIRSPYNNNSNSDESQQYTPKIKSERFARTNELAISASGYQQPPQQQQQTAGQQRRTSLFSNQNNLVHYVEHEDNVISINNINKQDYDFEYDDEDESNVIIVKSVSSSNFN